jgi:ABC-type bacteriocin/lantibiotic exporter with double-glycine peptidase domain
LSVVQPFSLRWFIPEILRQRTAFVDIAIAVLFINAIALVTPIFFQIVIDKVLVNQAFTTLHVLGIGMTAMLVVNGCLDFLRDYLLLHATNKLDLKEISPTIPAGTTLGIVGPSGSGKTTLTRMLQKAYFPSTGTIRINNCYLDEIDTAHLRRNTGVVLHESFLFRASVAENIRAGQAGASREQIIEAAILAGADEFIVKLPQGYDTLLEEGASNMSGGKRQRLAIARALLTRPEILILDEATSSLDPESERIVRENLAKISRGRTVFIVSHRLPC